MAVDPKIAAAINATLAKSKASAAELKKLDDDLKAKAAKLAKAAK